MVYVKHVLVNVFLMYLVKFYWTSDLLTCAQIGLNWS